MLTQPLSYAMVLRVWRDSYAMCGTDLAYDAIRGACVRCYAMRGTELAYGATRQSYQGTASCRNPGCYAMSGTDLAYAAIDVPNAAIPRRACYAVSSTDRLYAAIPLVRACYAVPSREITCTLLFAYARG
eukprot:574347-Rhodomonas_salina.2